MINTKQVVPALVAVTLLSLAPAAEALAIEEHAQAAKPAAVAADKPAGGKGEKGEQKSGGYAALKRKSPPPFPPRCGALKVPPLWKTRWVYHSGLENL